MGRGGIEIVGGGGLTAERRGRKSAAESWAHGRRDKFRLGAENVLDVRGAMWCACG